MYDLSTFKVIKAIRGLGAEVSSIVCMKRPGSELRDAWVAHGSKVGRRLLEYLILQQKSCVQISKFQLDSQKMIQDLSDALMTIEVTDEESDVLNEVRRVLASIQHVDLYKLGSFH